MDTGQLTPGVCVGDSGMEVASNSELQRKTKCGRLFLRLALAPVCYSG